MKSMISYPDALKMVLAAASRLPGISLPLSQARQHVLYETILAPIDHPIFDQSAVDGYAFRFADLAANPSLPQIGQVQAGAQASEQVRAGTCMRIFTGAPVPEGADTVVMQEYCQRDGDEIRIADPGLKPGGNIRRAAEQIRRGQEALPAGTPITAAAVGFLASLGISEVTVYQRPKVAILVTGDEFAEGPQDLNHGKIYESNGQMLQTALASLGIDASFTTVVDQLDTLKEAVGSAAQEADILLVTGGVSVGDFDFTPAALAANGFETGFHKVRQKPGKPLLFCQRSDCDAFGLPGNPRAVLMAFYLYILPYIRRKMGLEIEKTATQNRKIYLPLAHDHKKRPDEKTHFVTGKLDAGKISLLRGQNSHMLQSFALADAIAILPETRNQYAAGDLLEILLLPG